MNYSNSVFNHSAQSITLSSRNEHRLFKSEQRELRQQKAVREVSRVWLASTPDRLSEGAPAVQQRAQSTTNASLAPRARTTPLGVLHTTPIPRSPAAALPEMRTAALNRRSGEALGGGDGGSVPGGRRITLIGGGEVLHGWWVYDTTERTVSTEWENLPPEK